MSPSIEWQAALVLLDHPALQGRVEHYLDDDTETIAADITNEPWSSGQLELIELAESLISFDAWWPKRAVMASTIVLSRKVPNLAFRHGINNLIEIKTPMCPKCGTPPFTTHFMPWFCPNDDCDVLAWPPDKTVEELLPGEKINIWDLPTS